MSSPSPSSDYDTQPLLRRDSEELQREALSGDEGDYHDLAASFLLQEGHPPKSHPAITSTDERRVRTISTLRLVPMLLLLMAVKQLHLCRLNYGMWKAARNDKYIWEPREWWNKHLLRWLCYFTAQLLAQLPWSYVLVKWPIRKGLRVSLLGSSVCFVIASFVYSTIGDIILQPFLGAFSAALEPGIVAITQIWWRRRYAEFSYPIVLG